MFDGVVLTTANNLEGFVILEHCGIVFGEHLFINRFEDVHSISLTGFSVHQKEYQMTMNSLDKAKEIACNKLIEQAQSRGANAVIAIQTDTTFGDNVVYFSMCGTAVKVSLPDEVEEYERQEAERAESEAKLAAEQKAKAAEKRKALNEKRRLSFAKGEILPEYEFLDEIKALSSMMDIWKKWNEYNLKQFYPEVDEYIENAKDVERMYGIKDVSKRKREINNMLQ